MFIPRLLQVSLVAACLALAGCAGGGAGSTGGSAQGGNSLPIGYYGDKTGQTSTYGISLSTLSRGC